VIVTLAVDDHDDDDNDDDYVHRHNVCAGLARKYHDAPKTLHGRPRAARTERCFQNINLYYYYLLTFLIHAYPTQTAEVPKLLDGAIILTKILTLWVGRNNVTVLQTRQTDGSCHKANVT